jgi:transketolase
MSIFVHRISQIMAERIDIERLIMQTCYELSLATRSVSTKSVNIDYEKRIRELLEATSTLQESNKILGEKVESLKDENAALYIRIGYLEG